MAADLYAGKSLTEINSLLRRTKGMIDKVKSGLEALQEATGQAGASGGQAPVSPGVRNLEQIAAETRRLEDLRKTEAALEAARDARTALTVTETTEVTAEGAAQTGLVARLASIGRALGVGGEVAAPVAGGAALLGGAILAAILTYYGARALGTRMADKSVAYGDQKANIERMLTMPVNQRERLRKLDDPERVEPASTREGYAIWLVGDWKEVIVGRKSVIEEQPSSSLIRWGLDPSPVKNRHPSWQRVGAFYRTAEEARIAYQHSLVGGSIRRLPLARGMVARFNFDNREHLIDNAVRFLR